MFYTSEGQISGKDKSHTMCPDIGYFVGGESESGGGGGGALLTYRPLIVIISKFEDGGEE